MKILTGIFFAASLFAQNYNKINIIPTPSQTSVGEIDFWSKTQAHYVGLASPDGVGANIRFRLPAVDGSSGNCLTTNGSLILSFNPCGLAPPVTLTYSGTSPVISLTNSGANGIGLSAQTSGNTSTTILAVNSGVGAFASAGQFQAASGIGLVVSGGLYAGVFTGDMSVTGNSTFTGNVTVTGTCTGCGGFSLPYSGSTSSTANPEAFTITASGAGIHAIKGIASGGGNGGWFIGNLRFDNSLTAGTTTVIDSSRNATLANIAMSGNFSGTHAQNVGTGDTVTFNSINFSTDWTLSRSTNVLEFRDSGGGLRFSMNATGVGIPGGGVYMTSATIYATPTNDTTANIVARGRSSGTQSSDLFRAESAGGTDYFSIGPTGTLAGLHGQNIGTGDSPTFVDISSTTISASTTGQFPVQGTTSHTAGVAVSGTASGASALSSGGNFSSTNGTGITATGGAYAAQFIGTVAVTGSVTVSANFTNTASNSGSFFVGTSGNFYNRAYSGNPSCSGVTNGWMGWDTTNLRLNVCSGSTRYDIGPSLTIGGSNQQIQFNNSGALGGSASLTWNGATLTANSIIASNGLTVSANGIDSENNSGYAGYFHNTTNGNVVNATTTGTGYGLVISTARANSINASDSGGTCIFGTGTVAGCTSDRRFKTDIHPIHSILGKVSLLRPVTFQRIGIPGVIQAGFIAQEVSDIFPDLVHDIGEDKGLILNQQGFIPYLVRAIQDQQIQIEDLKRKIRKH